MTADEFMRAFNTDEELSFDNLHGCDATEDTLKIMVQFAKYHVLKAQEAASIQNRLKVTSGWGSYNDRSTSEIHYTGQTINRNNPGYGDCSYEIIEPDRAIIFEAYPLENIK